MEMRAEQFQSELPTRASAPPLEDAVVRHGVICRFLGQAIGALMDAELDEHLGYPRHALAGRNSGNSRNGRSKKTVRSSLGTVEIAVPRDRNGTFEPKLLRKHHRALGDMEDRILALHAQGMSAGDIEMTLDDIYGARYSHATIAQFMERILPKVERWRTRALESRYEKVHLEAIHCSVRQWGELVTRAVYAALGLTAAGSRHLLGLWVCGQEGMRYWQMILTDIHARGVAEIQVLYIGGITVPPEAMASVFPSSREAPSDMQPSRRPFVPGGENHDAAPGYPIVHTSRSNW